MDAVASTYRKRIRPLNRRPCVKVKRRLFPADVIVNRPAAKVHRRLLNRRRLLIVHAAFLAVTAAVAAYCLCGEEEGCSDEELAPIIESLRSLASGIRANTAVGAPVQDEEDSGRVE